MRSHEFNTAAAFLTTDEAAYRLAKEPVVLAFRAALSLLSREERRVQIEGLADWAFSVLYKAVKGSQPSYRIPRERQVQNLLNALENQC